MEKFSKTLKFLMTLLIFYIFSMVIAIVLICILFEDPRKYTFLLVILSYLITFTLLFYFSKQFKILINKHAFKKISLKNIYYISLFGLGFNIIISVFIFFLDRIFPNYTEISNQNFSMINLIYGIILIPICEEIFFRGIIFNFLKKNYSLTISIILQALFFGIAHGTIVQGIYTFIGGITLALAFLYSDSILGSILLHIMFNLCGLVVIPKLLFIHGTVNYLLLGIGIIIFIFSSFQIVCDVKLEKKHNLT